MQRGIKLMINAEEKLMRMHEKAAELQKKRELSGLRTMGALSAGLLACLVLLIQRMQNLQHVIMSSQNTGSSLLSDSVGGFVLVALIAFFAGVIITVLIIRKRKNE